MRFPSTINERTFAKAYNHILKKLIKADFAPITVKMKKPRQDVEITPFLSSHKEHYTLDDVEYFLFNVTETTCRKARNLTDLISKLLDFPAIYQIDQKRIANMNAYLAVMPVQDIKDGRTICNRENIPHDFDSIHAFMKDILFCPDIDVTYKDFNVDQILTALNQFATFLHWKEKYADLYGTDILYDYPQLQ